MAEIDDGLALGFGVSASASDNDDADLDGNGALSPAELVAVLLADDFDGASDTDGEEGVSADDLDTLLAENEIEGFDSTSLFDILADGADTISPEDVGVGKDDDDDNGGGGSPCFIATAAYGTPAATELTALHTALAPIVFLTGLLLNAPLASGAALLKVKTARNEG